MRYCPRWFAILLPVIIATFISGCRTSTNPASTVDADKFEIVRTHIQAWLSKESVEKLLISPLDLKKTIVDDWIRQKDKFQIVSVRTPDDYAKAGHIAHAINVYWAEMVNDNNLAQLDPRKIQILYCYYGHGSMISLTMLELLGYECRSLSFGIMGWNLGALIKEPWDRKADYAVEMTINTAEEQHSPPVLRSRQTYVQNIIKEAARNYLSGEGSPVIESSDVKAIIDDWISKKAEYQIMDVRSEQEYRQGHVPHAIHIPWTGIAEIGNLRRLAPQKTVIVYSENGQTGQLATTALSLLGYHAVNMKFGMMDWNARYVEASNLWNGAIGFAMDYLPQEPGSYPRK